MNNDLKNKTLEELRELHEQLTHNINVMDHMRVRQIDIAVVAAGDAAKELTSERRVAIHADINSRFLPSLNDLDNQLAACQRGIDRLGRHQNPNC
jgi:intracellular sulfur oxidation DsrE/DsrF family protein